MPEKSIAVLPFENLSDEKQNAYFTDGVQDEILTDLARIADLKVISRTSVMQYKTGAQRNLREIGQQLGVAQATAQCVDLLEGGAPGIHFYTLNQSPATRMILTALKATRLA